MLCAYGLGSYAGVSLGKGLSLIEHPAPGCVTIIIIAVSEPGLLVSIDLLNSSS